MKISYTLHALERMHKRRITRELVEKCLQRPDRDEELGEARRCIKKIDDKILVVIYKRENEKIVVITAYISSKIRKYLAA